VIFKLLYAFLAATFIIYNERKKCSCIFYRDLSCNCTIVRDLSKFPVSSRLAFVLVSLLLFFPSVCSYGINLRDHRIYNRLHGRTALPAPQSNCERCGRHETGGAGCAIVSTTPTGASSLTTLPSSVPSSTVHATRQRSVSWS
jgi:hypothetical protein